MTRFAFSWLVLFLGLYPASAQNAPAGSSPYIVVGFVGGYVKRTDEVHNVVRLAQKLRETYTSGVYVEIFENHHGDEAHDAVMHLLDSNHDGKWSPAEKAGARVILYGHSWGASEAIHLARALQKDKIPVLLTVQVDSVVKSGQNDELIPDNVAQAANFYQPHGLVHGENNIQAENARRTQILGNYRFDYSQASISCKGYPWWNQILMHSHIEIECDPKVWDQVEALIRSKLPPR